MEQSVLAVTIKQTQNLPADRITHIEAQRVSDLSFCNFLIVFVHQVEEKVFHAESFLFLQNGAFPTCILRILA